MSEVQINESEVADKAVDEHYKGLSEDDRKAFDNLDDDAKSTKKKEIGDGAIAKAKEAIKTGEGKETVPLSKFLEQKKDLKELQDKMFEIEKQTKEKQDEDLKKKGEFETLAETRKTELETANAKIAEITGQLQIYNDATEKKVGTFLEGVNEEDKTIVDALLTGKSITEKETLLPALIKKFGSEENINGSPAGGGDTKNKNGLKIEEAKTKLAEAQKAKNPMEVLKYQRTIRSLEV